MFKTYNTPQVLVRCLFALHKILVYIYIYIYTYKLINVYIGHYRKHQWMLALKLKRCSECPKFTNYKPIVDIVISNIKILFHSTNVVPNCLSNLQYVFESYKLEVPTCKSLKVKPCLNVLWEEPTVFKVGRSSSVSSFVIILCIMIHAYLTSKLSDIFHNMQGCVIMDQIACITPKHLSTSLRAYSWELAKWLSN